MTIDGNGYQIGFNLSPQADKRQERDAIEQVEVESLDDFTRGQSDRLYLEEVVIHARSLLVKAWGSLGFYSFGFQQTLAGSELWLVESRLVPFFSSIYLSRYGKAITQNIPKLFPEAVKVQIRALSEGRRAEALVSEYHAICKGFLLSASKRRKRLAWFTESLHCRIEFLSAEERNLVLTHLQNLSPLEPLEREPHQFCGEAELIEEIQAVFRGDIIGSRAFRVRRFLDSKNDQGLLELFCRWTDSEIKELSICYRKMSGEELHTTIRRVVSTAAVREHILALIAGDPQAALLTAYYCALTRVRSICWGELFLGRSAEERAELVRSYSEVFPEVKPDSLLAQNYSKREISIINRLIECGDVSPGELLLFCVEGWGTDEEGVMRILSSLTQSEFEQAREDYYSLWKKRAGGFERLLPGIFGNLEKRLWIETGGDSWCRIQDHLHVLQTGNCDRGAVAVRAEQIVQKARRWLLHERSSAFVRLIARYASEVRQLEASFLKLEQYAEWLKQDTVFSNPVGLSRLEFLSAHFQSNCQAVREIKHRVSNLLATIATAFFLFFITYSLMVLDLRLPYLMLTVAVLSIAMRLMFKRFLKGAGYHWDDVATDVFIGFIDGLTLYCGRLLRRAMFRGGTRVAGKLGFRSGIDRFRSKLNERRLSRMGLLAARVDE